MQLASDRAGEISVGIRPWRGTPWRSARLTVRRPSQDDVRRGLRCNRMEVRHEERLSAGRRGGFRAVDSLPGGRRLGGAVHDDLGEPGVEHEPVRVVRHLCIHVPGRGQLGEQRTRAVRRGQSARPVEHHRRLPAGSVQLRRRHRTGCVREPRRRTHVEHDVPALHDLLGRNRCEPRRLPARVRPVGHVLAGRHRVLHQPLAQLRRRRHADRQRDPGQQVDRRRRHLERPRRRSCATSATPTSRRTSSTTRSRSPPIRSTRTTSTRSGTGCASRARPRPRVRKTRSPSAATRCSPARPTAARRGSRRGRSTRAPASPARSAT